MNDLDFNEIVEQIVADPEGYGMDDAGEDEEMADWYPEEYVIMFNGFRGSGKSLGVIWFGAWHLKYRDDIEVYTDLDYIFENLVRDGFKKMPLVLNWDDLISFRLEQPPGAMNQIDEVDTKIDKLRTVTNQNLVTTKFLEQIRKRSLKFVLSCQFGHYLPYGTLDQVDLNIQCRDLFFTPAGRENGLKKGQRFLYIVQDKSGYFTGGQTNRPICFTLDGRPIWDYYKTDKIHNTFQFAKKYKFESGENIVGPDGEIYPSGEQRAQDEERQFRQYRDTLGMIRGSQFWGWLTANADVLGISDNGNYISVSDAQISKTITKTKGQHRTLLEKAHCKLQNLAKQGGPVRMIQRNNGSKFIEIMKPDNFARPDEELIPTPGLAEEEGLW